MLAAKKRKEAQAKEREEALKKKAAEEGSSNDQVQSSSSSSTSQPRSSDKASTSSTSTSLLSTISPNSGVSSFIDMEPCDIRLQREFTEMDENSELPSNVNLEVPDPNNLREFFVTITPLEGLWRHAAYKFSVEVGLEYPYKPPKVTCETKILHPNIELDSGKVCLNLLREDWRPVLTLTDVFQSLLFLMYEPNPTDPLNKEAARLFHDDKEQFERKVAQSLKGGIVDGVRFPKLK